MQGSFPFGMLNLQLDFDTKNNPMKKPNFIWKWCIQVIGVSVRQWPPHVINVKWLISNQFSFIHVTLGGAKDGILYPKSVVSDSQVSKLTLDLFMHNQGKVVRLQNAR